MFDFFLVEDEAPVRSALRRGFPWQAQGFSCSGEASDGELALPILRRSPPDLLVTDLHMPFVDGLELCRQVRGEFPGTKLLLLSRRAGEEELQAALALGVDGFLSKPVDHEQLSALLSRLRRELEGERAQQRELEQLRERAAHWEELSREQFFFRLLEGTQSVQSLYQQAKSLGLELRSQRYCLLMCVMCPLETDQACLREVEEAQRELKLFFSRAPRMHSFGWHPSGFSVLLLSDEGAIEREMAFCIQNIRHRLLPLGRQCRWVVSVSEPVKRLRSLRRCYDQALEELSWSHMAPEERVLSPETLQSLLQGKLEPRLRSLAPEGELSRELEVFLTLGEQEQAGECAQQCADSLGEGAMEVPQLCLYILLRVRLEAERYVASLGREPQELLSAVENLPGIELMVGRTNVVLYLTALLSRAVELRVGALKTNYHSAVQQGLRLVEKNYANPAFNLSAAAQAAGVTPNYFSYLFRRCVGTSFSAYLTGQRMERARELLRSTDLSSAQVGAAVGYQDASYFSAQFRKTQGCTPREYRSRERKRGQS